MNRRNVLTGTAIMLSVLLTGCHHSSKATQQVAPSLPPAVGPVMVSVPPPTHHDRPEEPVETKPVIAPVHEPARRPSRQTKRNTAPASVQPAATPSASAAAPPIALGELSAGSELSSSLRQQTADLLKAQQQRLDTISRVSPSAHPTEVAQAKGFLQRANASWNAADYEGAHTLAVKAKVLLDDLKQ